MSTIDLEDEMELTSEIDDLSSYLRGVPADLRESGAFTPYEVRLQLLLETLLTFRLKQTLHRYETALAGNPSSEQRATYAEIQEWVRSAERRYEEAAQDYLRVTNLLNRLVVELEQRRP
jgi:hypothetical protein